MMFNISLRPIERSLSPNLARGSPSTRESGRGKRGIGVRYAASRKAVALDIKVTNSGQRAASFAEKRWIASAVLDGSAYSTRRSASGSRETNAGLGAAGRELNPYRGRVRERVISGRRVPVWSVSAMKPLNSSVTREPPAMARRSSTITFLPALARVAAATSPLWPAPMMIAS